jgi:hypothetical protein
MLQYNLFPIFRTQYTPDFFVAEYYGLRNTAAYSGLRISA